MVRNQKMINPFYQAFACFRIDSVTCGDLFPVYSHRHYFSEILLVREGTCRVLRKNITHILQAGEGIYFSPLVLHSVESADGKPVVFDVVKFSSTRLKEIPSYFSDLRAFALDAAQIRFPIQMNVEDVKNHHIDSIIRECLLESERQSFAWDLKVRALIYLLITALARFWLEKRDLLLDRKNPEPDPILAVPGYVEQHIGEPLRVEELARQCGMSYPWFAKRFRDFFGISCKQFIEYMRADAVEQYLIYTDLSLSEISLRTGYTDCSHMVKSFRKLKETTPGQFRSVATAKDHTPFFRFSEPAYLNWGSKG